MHRMKKNRGFKWEPNWIKYYDEGQTDQGEVLDDCCRYVTFALRVLRSKSYVIIYKISIFWIYLYIKILK